MTFLLQCRGTGLSRCWSVLIGRMDQCNSRWKWREGIELPYLDMVVFRVDRKLKTKWYTKPTSSNCIIGYTSCHSSGQKIKTASGMIERAYRLTDMEYRNEIDVKIEEILRNNNYLTHMIRRFGRERAMDVNENRVRHYRLSNIRGSHQPLRRF